jgi:hypothetical protein
METPPVSDGIAHADGNGFVSRVTGLEFRYGELKQDVSDLKQQLAAGFSQISADIRQNRERNDLRIETLSTAIAEKSKTNWGVIGACAFGMFGIISTLVGAGWYVTTQQTQLLATPLTLKAAMLDKADESHDRRLAVLEGDLKEAGNRLNLNDARDSMSIQDRSDVKSRLERDESRTDERLSTLENKMSAVIERQCEAETQFSADEIRAQDGDAYIQRWIGMLVERVFQQQLPPLAPRAAGLAVGKPCNRG